MSRKTVKLIAIAIAAALLLSSVGIVYFSVFR